MMTHQMAAAHNTIMKVAEQINRGCERMEYCGNYSAEAMALRREIAQARRFLRAIARDR